MAGAQVQFHPLFEAAVKFVSKPTVPFKATEEIQLQLYAHYKQALQGPCDAPKPSFWDFVGKAKWEAWKALGSLSNEEASARYVELVSELSPGWLWEPTLDPTGPTTTSASSSSSSTTAATKVEDDEDLFDDSDDEGQGKRGSKWGPIFSVPVPDDVEQETSSTPDVCYYASLGDMAKVKELLEAEGGNVNWKDKEERTPLHWACDRGHQELFQLLVSKNADLNARDADGLTPLHYASMCGHPSLVKELLARGADLNAEDEDGATPLDMADDPEIKSLFNK